jgi:hypothetical protein
MKRSPLLNSTALGCSSLGLVQLPRGSPPAVGFVFDHTEIPASAPTAERALNRPDATLLLAEVRDVLFGAVL